jgi:hypothetical protein
VDTFNGSREHWLSFHYLRQLPFIERRFDRNLAPFAARVEKRKAKSVAALGTLGLEQRQFDLIYIDGSHVAIDVYRDDVPSWPLVKSRGIVIFDDYAWPGDDLPETLKPQLGIDAFLTTVSGRYCDLHRGYQLIIAKVASPSWARGEERMLAMPVAGEEAR